MEQRDHPTHHSGYYATLIPLYATAALGVAVTVAAATLAVLDGQPGARHALEGIGVLCSLGAALVAGMKVLAHAFATCPNCQARVRRSQVDASRTYYPCERCGITWTCSCAESGVGD